MRGHEVLVIAPDAYRSVPCPTYPEIRLALPRPGSVERALTEFAPDAIHIATEGPLGAIARRLCGKRCWPFTTAYHTQFPAYLARRTGLPENLFWRYIRWFHRPATRIMVATESIRAELAAQSLANTHRWSRGVDLARFTSDAAPPPEFAALAKPIQLYVGRVAVEKNIEAFLTARHPRQQGGRRRWPRSGEPQGALRRHPLPWSPGRPGASRMLRWSGRIRVSEPYRHLRARHYRSAGLRNSGRRVSRRRPHRYRYRKNRRAQRGPRPRDRRSAISANLRIAWLAGVNSTGTRRPSNSSPDWSTCPPKSPLPPERSAFTLALAGVRH